MARDDRPAAVGSLRRTAADPEDASHDSTPGNDAGPRAADARLRAYNHGFTVDGARAAPESRIIVKWVIIVAFVLIIGSLGSALFFLIRDRGRTRNTARALGFRVGFSIALFLLILFAQQMGWIHSTGVPITR